MRAEYAADLTRQYGLFIMVPNGPRPLLVASGPDAEDYPWTEVMKREVGADGAALALHYYTIPARKGAFGSGTDFGETTYASTRSKTRSAERRVGKECVGTVRLQWSQYR